MRTVIKDDSGYEEVVHDDITLILVIIIFMGTLIILIAQTLPQVPFLIIVSILFIFACLSIFWNEEITFNKGTKSLIFSSLRYADKKIKWKETKKIKFSDITMVTIEKFQDGEYIGYGTLITIAGGTSINVLSHDSEKDAKELAIRLCKITGANGYYIDEKKKSTPLIEAT